MLIIIAISTVFMAVLIIGIIRKLLMPIINLRNASEKIAEGELGITVEKEGDDEIASLTGSFNTMSTRVKKMHAELEKSNIKLANIGYARKQMLQMISHELRTPVTGVIGFYELVDEQIKSGDIQKEGALEEVKELLGHMGTSIQEFELIVKRLTKASSLVSQEATRAGELFAPSDVGSTLRVVSLKTKSQLAERKINLEIDVPAECVVACPSDMLELLFEEALSNAVKYSDDGSSIKIDAQIVEDVVEISVHDDGCGIPRKYIDEVVEPFFEVADALHHSTGRYKAEGGGLGLGMTIIINIVKKFGGVLEIDSKENEGTTLHITLPLSTE
jgi:signal transduction histidine kinase